MSEEGGIGIAVSERFFGLIVIIIGALAAYFTFTSFSALGSFTFLFGALSIIAIVIGFIMLTAKME